MQGLMGPPPPRKAKPGAMLPPASRPSRVLTAPCYKEHHITQEDDHSDIMAIGYRSKIYQDDEAAMIIDREEHMIKWMDNDEQNLLIDRYDVRALVDDERIFMRKKVQTTLSAEELEEESMLDEERYIGLPSEEEQESDAPHSIQEPIVAPAPAVHEEEFVPAQGEYTAVHFAFDPSSAEGGIAANRASPVLGAGSDQQQESVPAEIKELASRLGLGPECAFPKSIKQHQAIEKTARFVYKQGDKMEATLKVRHGGNPAFGFLLVGHGLQAYYQAIKAYLRNNPEAAQSASLLPPEDQSSADAPGKSNNIAEENIGESAEQVKAPVVGGVETSHVAAVRGMPNMEGTPVVIENSTVQVPAVVAAKVEKSIAIPSEEMRATIEKLVQWVAKSGKEFETKVRERQRGDPRFEFLLPWNPFNAYYRQQLEAAEARRQEELANPTAESKDGSTDVSKEGSEADKAKQGDEQSASAPASSEEKSVYDPHAVTVRRAITSFGGEDSAEEEEDEEEGKDKSAESANSEQVDDAGDKDVAKVDKEGQEGGDKQSKSKAGISEVVKRAARLQRAKLLAEKLQEPGDGDQEDQDKARTRSPKHDDADDKLKDRSDKPKSSEGSRKRDSSRERERSSSRRRSRDRGSKDGNSSRRRSKSRSRSRDRKHSKKHKKHKSSRRSRSRSNDRSRDRSHDRSRDRRSRSRSRDSKRSDSRSTRRSRSRSRERKSRERRSRERKSRERRSRERRSRERRSREKRSRSRSRSRERRQKHDRRSRSRSHSKKRKRSRSRSGSRKRKGLSSSRDRGTASKSTKASTSDETGRQAEGGSSDVVVSEEFRNKIRAILGSGDTA